MGIWYICRDDARADERIAAASLQFVRHGHDRPRQLRASEHRILHAGHIYPGPATFAEMDADWIAVAGTLFYRGKVGEPALKALLADFTPSFDRWADILGHFAVALHKGGKLFVFTDWAASFHLYRTADHSVMSTSFLATARSLNRLTFKAQGVYEFVFNGMPLGEETVFEQISRHRRTQIVELGATVAVHEAPRKLAIAESGEAVDAMIARIAASLRAAFAAPALHFAGNIQCPLSGGFDSRLVLALLLDAGARPSLYVYGASDSIDVQIATHIAKAEGFAIEVFEKAAFRRITPDEFPEIAERNFHEMDGTPMDGGMFDAGGNAKARHDRARGGALAVSGAAGEIFRNYFYLADRPLSTKAIVDSFYVLFDPADCTDAFSEQAYVRAVDEKVQLALGVGTERRSRLEIESAYTLFRCPAAFGREISMVGRFGSYFVPFCEYVVAREAANIPVRLRTHGVFQSMLMQHVNRRLAAYPSAYGHSFVEPPSFGHRLADATSLYRPPWLRRYSYRMKRALVRQENPRTGFMSEEFLGRVIDTSFPAMSRFFRMDRLSDRGFLLAISTLEYLAAHFARELSH